MSGRVAIREAIRERLNRNVTNLVVKAFVSTKISSGMTMEAVGSPSAGSLEKLKRTSTILVFLQLLLLGTSSLSSAEESIAIRGRHSIRYRRNTT